MALDPRYVVAVSLQEVFTNKDTGLVLSNGKLLFFKDDSRQDPKDVFVLSGVAPNYTYTNIGSEVTLNVAGSPQYNGNNVNIYYFPYDEDGELELYYVLVEDENQTEQFTREARPNVFGPTSSGDNGASSFTNYIPNGQFESHIDIDNNGLITEAVTDIALGGWTFERPFSSTATDNVTFKRFNNYTANPEANPRWALNVQSSGGAGDLFKDIRIKFNDVNEFASETQEFTFKFSGRSLLGELSDVQLVLIKNYGAGGDAQTETVIDTFSIDAAFTSYLTSFVFGTNEDKAIGLNDDDFIQLALRLPVNVTLNVDITNADLREGAFSELNFPDTTTRQTISQALGGAFPKPNPDGSDLYLTPRLTPSGSAYDKSVVGSIVARATNVVYPGEVPADGRTLTTADKSADGIPYSRLLNVYLTDPFDQVPLFGTGSQNFTSYFPGETGTDGFMIVSNEAGVAANASDGIAPTGFTFNNIYSSVAASYGINAWIEEPGNIYVQLQTAGVVANPSDVDSTIVFKSIVGSTSITPLEFAAALPDGATLNDPGNPGKHWLLDTVSTNYYVWYQVSTETDPAVAGRTGIQVNVSVSDNAVQVAEKTASALSNFVATSIQVAATPPNSSYFLVSIPSEDFYVWFNVDGAGVDPAVSGRTGIEIAISSSSGFLVSTIIDTLNTRKFAVPDYRGMFLRGVTEGRSDIGLDNPAVRFSRYNFKHSSSGGDEVATEELSTGRSHSHGASSVSTSDTTLAGNFAALPAFFSGPNEVYTKNGGSPGVPFGTLANNFTSANWSTSTSTTTTIQNAQNTESRPANSAVLYVIKI